MTCWSFVMTGKAANCYLMKCVLYYLIGCSVICPAHIMTDGVVVKSEHPFLISIQLNHRSTLLSVPLQDAAHLSSVFSQNHHYIVRVVLGYNCLQHFLSNIVQQSALFCTTNTSVRGQDVLHSHLRVVVFSSFESFINEAHTEVPLEP